MRKLGGKIKEKSAEWQAFLFTEKVRDLQDVDCRFKVDYIRFHKAV